LAEKLYPLGEEDSDWAETTARIEAECRAVAEDLRKGRNRNGDNEGPTLNYQDWKEKQPEIEGEPFQNSEDRDDHQEIPSQQTTDFTQHALEDSGELYEVDGELAPLVPEGSRIMVCTHYEIRPTLHGPKDYLFWYDENSPLVLTQYFPHYKKYPIGSKAVQNYIVGIGERPKRLDRMTLRHLVGLRAEVYVETVTRTFSTGALKGKPKHESLNYSKVAEIIRPLGRVDTNTLNQLRKRC